MLALGVVLAIVVGAILVLLFQGAAILFAYTMPLLGPAPPDRPPRNA